jgi:hypothetical protein
MPQNDSEFQKLILGWNWTEGLTRIKAEEKEATTTTTTTMQTSRRKRRDEDEEDEEAEEEESEFVNPADSYYKYDVNEIFFFVIYLRN